MNFGRVRQRVSYKDEPIRTLPLPFSLPPTLSEKNKLFVFFLNKNDDSKMGWEYERG